MGMEIERGIDTLLHKLKKEDPRNLKVLILFSATLSSRREL